MDEKELKNITVLIAGRPYPLRVEEADETSVRQIVKEVNEKTSNFQLNYNKKDKQDCLSMALLTYAVDLHKWRTGKQQLENKEAGNASENPKMNAVSEKIEQLDQLLDTLLK
ncbi:MAG: cell division protein ZapA (FtsZ GTPase activity inhibitor) [Polaribacter sp.]|jgi:cell division protein ZapA (FtsZ GTPase activity inhibitor)